MELDWKVGAGGDDNVWWGFDDDRFLCATVVRYRDTVDGHGPRFGPPWWAAFVAQERVEGRYETAELAVAAAEQAHHGRSFG